MITEIYLDMDGVLTSCHEDAVRYMLPHLQEIDWPKGWWTEKVISFYDNDKSFDWDALGFSFWATLGTSAMCHSLFNTCVNKVGRDNVFILSRPTGNPQSWSGKVAWVQNNLDLPHSQIILTEQKSKCAGHGRLLIDDKPSNCSDFTKAGGIGYLVPRPWNGTPSDDELVLLDIALMDDMRWPNYACGCHGTMPDHGSADWRRLGMAHLSYRAAARLRR